MTWPIAVVSAAFVWWGGQSHGRGVDAEGLAARAGGPGVSPKSRMELGALHSPRVLSVTVGRTVDIGLQDALDKRTHAYLLAFVSPPNGLRIEHGRVRGIPLQPQVVRIAAKPISVPHGAMEKTDTIAIVVFAANLPEPVLPQHPYAYRGASLPLPRRLTDILSLQNEQERAAARANPLTDAGVQLGRVLFYDTRLSANDRVSCASCHRQEFGFGDTAQTSRGVGARGTGRHAIALGNAALTLTSFSWEGRFRTIESQVQRALFDPEEHAMTEANIEAKLAATPYYRALFTSAFGSGEITASRVTQALAQFVRALVSDSAPYDYATENGSPTTAARRMTSEQFRGMQRFNRAGCVQCHYGVAQVARTLSFNGIVPPGAPDSFRLGRAPSLRNVAVRGRYMHTGSVRSLEDVLALYERTPPRIAKWSGMVQQDSVRMELSGSDRADIVAFLHTLTDSAFLKDERYANPFGPVSARPARLRATSPRAALPRSALLPVGNAPARSPLDSARFVDGRLLIEPLGVSIVLPPIWLDATRGFMTQCDSTSPHGRQIVTDAASLRALTGTTDYYKDWQYSVVADSLFPPREIVAHVGSGGWAHCGDGFIMHARVYVSDREPAAIIARTQGLVVDSFPGFSRITARTPRDSAGWQVVSLDWIFNCGDCIAIERMDIMSQRVGGRTLSLVFMHGAFGEQRLQIRGMAQSVQFRTTDLPAPPPPDSIVYTDGECRWNNCHTWRATVLRTGFVRFTRTGGPGRTDSVAAPGLYDSLRHVMSTANIRGAPAMMDESTGLRCRFDGHVRGVPTFVLYGTTGIEKQVSLSKKCGRGQDSSAVPSAPALAWLAAFAAMEGMVRDRTGFGVWLERSK